MLKILKNLKDCRLAVVAIIALLIIQAYCDLALPQFTADIVDVGIGQGGVESAVPEKMRAETFDYLSLFMTEEEISLMSGAYEADSDGNYVLQEKDKEIKEQLNTAMSVPMVILSIMENPEELAAMMGSMQSGESGRKEAARTPEEQGTAGMPEAGSVSLETIKQMADAGQLQKEQLLELRQKAEEGF